MRAVDARHLDGLRGVEVPAPQDRASSQGGALEFIVRVVGNFLKTPGEEHLAVRVLVLLVQMAVVFRHTCHCVAHLAGALRPGWVVG